MYVLCHREPACHTNAQCVVTLGARLFALARSSSIRLSPGPRRRSCLSKDSHPGDSAHAASPLPPGSFVLGPPSSRGLGPGQAGEVHNSAGGTVPIKAEATGAMPEPALGGLQPNPALGGPGWEAGAPGVGPGGGGGGGYGHAGGQIFSLLDQNYALQVCALDLTSVQPRASYCTNLLVFFVWCKLYKPPAPKSRIQSQAQRCRTLAQWYTCHSGVAVADACTACKYRSLLCCCP